MTTKLHGITSLSNDARTPVSEMMMKPAKKPPTQLEIEQFFWNCQVAAKLLDEVPRNTATRACVLYAVRKASVCYAGRNGVRYASSAAKAKQASMGTHWEKSGLVREHVVPVSLIRERVVRELDITRTDTGPARGALSEEDVHGLTPDAVRLFEGHPRAWQVGRIIRDWTLLAWITREEERVFDEKARHGGISLRKRMPIGWSGDDRFARYTSCGIELLPI